MRDINGTPTVIKEGRDGLYHIVSVTDGTSYGSYFSWNRAFRSQVTLERASARSARFDKFQALAGKL